MARSKGITLLIEGVLYDQLAEREVSRDLKDFRPAFNFTFREPGTLCQRRFDMQSQGSINKTQAGTGGRES